MRTGQVEEAIKKVLGYLPEVRISAEEAPDEQTATRTIGVFALDPSKTQAAKEADDFARAYIQVRKGLIGEDLEANIQQNRDGLHQLDIDTANARNRLDYLNGKIPLSKGDERRVFEAERDRLVADIASGSVAQRQVDIQTTIAKLLIAKRNNDSRGIFKRSIAEIPSTPITPQPVATPPSGCSSASGSAGRRLPAGLLRRRGAHQGGPRPHHGRGAGAGHHPRGQVVAQREDRAPGVDRPPQLRPRPRPTGACAPRWSSPVSARTWA